MITDLRIVVTRDGLVRLSGDKDGLIIGKSRSQVYRLLASREAARERAGDGTPLSDEAIAAWEDWADAMGYEYEDDPMWPEFRRLVTAKMERGKAEYGDASLALPWEAMLAAAAEEPVDVVGWTALAINRFPEHGSKIAMLHRTGFALWKAVVSEAEE